MRKLRKTLLPLLSLSLLACGTPDSMESAPDAGVDEPTLHSLTVASIGEGQAELLINGEPCTEDPCERSFASDSNIRLEVRPSLTSSFRAWSTDCGTANVCELVLSADTTLEYSVDISGELLEQNVLPEILDIERRAVDSQGNIYVLGSYRDSRRPVGIEPSGHQNNTYCTKFAPDLSRIWTVSLAEPLSTREVLPAFVGVDADDNVFVAVERLAAPGGAVVARLDPVDGSAMWAVQMEGAGRPPRFTVDGLGNTFISGTVSTARQAHVGALELPLQSSGPMLAVLNKEGAVQNLSYLPDLLRSSASGLTPLPSGGALLSRGLVNEDQFVEQYSTTGERVTATPVPVNEAGSAPEDRVVSASELAVAPNGDVVLLGAYRGRLHWGAEPNLQAPDSEAHGLYLGRISRDGTPRWLRGFPITNDAGSLFRDCLTVSDNDIVFACGAVGNQGQIDLGAGVLPRFDGLDGWVVSYSGEGEFRWFEQLASASGNFPFGVTLDADNTLRVFLMNTSLTTSLGAITGGGSVFKFRQ